MKNAKERRLVDIPQEVFTLYGKGVNTEPMFIGFEILGAQSMVNPRKDPFTYKSLLEEFFLKICTIPELRDKVIEYCRKDEEVFVYHPEWRLTGARVTFDRPEIKTKNTSVRVYKAGGGFWFAVIELQFIHEVFCKLLKNFGLEDKVHVIFSDKAANELKI